MDQPARGLGLAASSSPGLQGARGFSGSPAQLGSHPPALQVSWSLGNRMRLRQSVSRRSRGGRALKDGAGARVCSVAGTDSGDLSRLPGLRESVCAPLQRGLRVAAVSCLLLLPQVWLSQRWQILGSLAFQVLDPSGALVPERRSKSETETKRPSRSGETLRSKRRRHRERKSRGSEGQMRCWV